jgi:hypothetical protein
MMVRSIFKAMSLAVPMRYARPVGRGRAIRVGRNGAFGFEHGRRTLTPQSSDPHHEASLGRVALTPREDRLDRLANRAASVDRKRVWVSWPVYMAIAEESRVWPA